ncbi:hypothetical protein G9P44_006030 [Scheffersomyces stipitis]|nr:hypothetical protein G9P44_006030 [Scheffersomyces stipitis]
MSLQFKRNNNTARNLKVATFSGIIVVGASYLVLNTFPHLKTSIYDYLTGTQSEEESDAKSNKEERKEDYEPIELERKSVNKERIQNGQPSLSDKSQVDVASWSDAKLTKWLGDVSTININDSGHY